MSFRQHSMLHLTGIDGKQLFLSVDMVRALVPAAQQFINDVDHLEEENRRLFREHLQSLASSDVVSIAKLLCGNCGQHFDASITKGEQLRELADGVRIGNTDIVCPNCNSNLPIHVIERNPNKKRTQAIKRLAKLDAAGISSANDAAAASSNSRFFRNSATTMLVKGLPYYRVAIDPHSPQAADAIAAFYAVTDRYIDARNKRATETNGGEAANLDVDQLLADIGFLASLIEPAPRSAVEGLKDFAVALKTVEDFKANKSVSDEDLSQATAAIERISGPVLGPENAKHFSDSFQTLVRSAMTIRDLSTAGPGRQ